MITKKLSTVKNIEAHNKKYYEVDNFFYIIVKYIINNNILYIKILTNIISFFLSDIFDFFLESYANYVKFAFYFVFNYSIKSLIFRGTSN